MQGAGLHRSYRFRGVSWVLWTIDRRSAGGWVLADAWRYLRVSGPAESGSCGRSSLRDRTPNERWACETFVSIFSPLEVETGNEAGLLQRRCASFWSAVAKMQGAGLHRSYRFRGVSWVLWT
ncbi:MAG: hypothetical protein K9N47_15090 [Prosthecobacter sp.]|nr:hypothetical protein [Prosthecobacter sp.]